MPTNTVLEQTKYMTVWLRLSGLGQDKTEWKNNDYCIQVKYKGIIQQNKTSDKLYGKVNCGVKER